MGWKVSFDSLKWKLQDLEFICGDIHYCVVCRWGKFRTFLGFPRNHPCFSKRWQLVSFQTELLTFLCFNYVVRIKRNISFETLICSSQCNGLQKRFHVSSGVLKTLIPSLKVWLHRFKNNSSYFQLFSFLKTLLPSFKEFFKFSARATKWRFNLSLHCLHEVFNFSPHFYFQLESIPNTINIVLIMWRMPRW